MRKAAEIQEEALERSAALQSWESFFSPEQAKQLSHSRLVTADSGCATGVNCVLGLLAQATQVNTATYCGRLESFVVKVVKDSDKTLSVYAFGKVARFVGGKWQLA